MREERTEYVSEEEKEILFKELNGQERHGASFNITFDSFLFQLFFKDYLMFEYTENIPFDKVYYKSKRTNKVIVCHVIFDNSSIEYEELDYLEFYFVIYQNCIYFCERKVTSEDKYQRFMANRGKEYEEIFFSDQFIQVDEIFSLHEPILVNFYNGNVNYFPEMSPSLENFVNTILTMKKF
jgi:hypothetical protein